MAFQQPNFPIPPTKTEAFVAPVSQTIANLPSLIMQLMEWKRKRKDMATQNESQMALKRAELRGKYGASSLPIGGGNVLGGLPGISPAGTEFDAMSPGQKLGAFGSEGMKAMREGSVASPIKMRPLGQTEPDGGETVSYKPILGYNVIPGSDEPFTGTIYPFIRPEDRITEIPVGEAGRVTLANQSATETLPAAKAVLFPTGAENSYRRDVATMAMLPFIGKPMPFDKDAQNVNRWLSDALAGKILIQTGVAARPQEVAAEFRKFFPNFTSDPNSVLNGFLQLDRFYRDYITTVRTKKAPRQDKILPLKPPVSGGKFKIISVE